MGHDELIIFDLDDTLINTGEVFWRARSTFVQELVQQGYDPDLVLRLFEEIDTINIEQLGLTPGRYTKSMFDTYDYLLRLTGRSHCPEAQSRIESCGNIILDSRPELIEGAKELIEWAFTRFTLVLITRGDAEHQHQKLECTGLSKYFRTIEIVSRKDAETFRRVIENEGYYPSESWIVGDSIKSDINPGIEAGTKCIHYIYRHHSYYWQQEHGQQAIGSFYQAHSLQDVRDILMSPSSFMMSK